MTIKVDAKKCIGDGTCVSLCPQCFEMGNDQKAKVISQDCKDCDLKEVAQMCPVGAIEISEE